MKSLSIIFFIFITLTHAKELDILRYKVQKGDTLGSILNNFGICPLWGNGGHVKKLEALNNKVKPDELLIGSDIRIPYNYLKRLDKTIFLKNRYIIPKSYDQNICDDFLR